MAHVARMRAGDFAQKDRRASRRSAAEIGDSHSNNDPDEEMSEASRKKEIRKALKKSTEILLYVSFLVIFTIGTLYTRHPLYAFYHNDFMKDLFLYEEFPGIPTLKTFYDVATIDEMWEWIEGPLLDGLDTQDRFIYGTNRLMGYVRLRQLRVKRDSCSVISGYEDLFPICINEFKSSESVEERGPFGPGDGDAWTWHAPEDAITTSFNGRIHSYSGHGYFQYLTGINNSAAVATLKDRNWVDVQTSVVTVEFVTYNANVNLWLFARMVFEQLPSGGIVPSHWFSTMQLDNYDQSTVNGRTQLALDIVVYLFVIFYIIQEVWELCKKGPKGYALEGWNYVDVANLSFFLVSLGLRFAVNISANKRGLRALDDERYIDLGDVASLVQLQFNFNALNSFLLWFKVFKFLNFSKSTLIIFKTIQQGIVELVVFFIMICFLVIGFAQAGVMSFGTDVFGYREFRFSMYSLLRALLGDFDFEALYYTNRIMGPLYFTTFTVLFIFILLNLFLAIVNESYETICEEYAAKEIKENYFKTVWVHTKRKYPNSAVVNFIQKRIETIDSVQSRIRSGRADLNKDGVLDKQEFRNLEGMNSEIFDEADANHDGVLDDEEQKELMRRLDEERAALVGDLADSEAAIELQSVDVVAADDGVQKGKDIVRMSRSNTLFEAEVKKEIALLHKKIDMLVSTLNSGSRTPPPPPN